MSMFEIIALVLLVLLVIKAGYDYLNIEKNDNNPESDFDIENQIDQIQKSTVLIESIQNSLARFELPMDRLNSYLSGGTKGSGNFGEWQLQAMIPNLLPEELYETNCPIGKGNVEFAIKLDNGLLPIDSKFNAQKFKDYQDASQVKRNEEGEYKKVDSKNVIAAKNKFITEIKKAANDIEEKYIRPPRTLEFAILAIPTESMMQLIDSCTAKDSGEALKQFILRENKVMIMGPSVLASYITVHLMMVERVTLNDNTKNLQEKITQLKTNIKGISKTLNVVQKHKKDLYSSLSALSTQVEETENEIEATIHQDKE